MKRVLLTFVLLFCIVSTAFGQPIQDGELWWGYKPIGKTPFDHGFILGGLNGEAFAYRGGCTGGCNDAQGLPTLSGIDVISAMAFSNDPTIFKNVDASVSTWGPGHIDYPKGGDESGYLFQRLTTGSNTALVKQLLTETADLITNGAFQFPYHPSSNNSNTVVKIGQNVIQSQVDSNFNIPLPLTTMMPGFEQEGLHTEVGFLGFPSGPMFNGLNAEAIGLKVPVLPVQVVTAPPITPTPVINNPIIVQQPIATTPPVVTTTPSITLLPPTPPGGNVYVDANGVIHIEYDRVGVIFGIEKHHISPEEEAAIINLGGYAYNNGARTRERLNFTTNNPNFVAPVLPTEAQLLAQLAAADPTPTIVIQEPLPTNGSTNFDLTNVIIPPVQPVSPISLLPFDNTSTLISNAGLTLPFAFEPFSAEDFKFGGDAFTGFGIPGNFFGDFWGAFLEDGRYYRLPFFENDPDEYSEYAHTYQHAVPETSTWILMLTGSLLLFAYRRYYANINTKQLQGHM